MGGVVGMASGIATKIGRNVAGARIQVYVTVPMVTDGIGALIEKEIVCGRFETANYG